GLGLPSRQARQEGASSPLLLRRRFVDRAMTSERYPWLVLATVLLGLFAVGFTITILSNAIPRIARDLDSDVSTLTWVLTGPLFAFAVMGPAAGKLGDLYGQRRLYITSLVAVGVFAGLTALAPSAAWLIAFRVLGAATGAATGPASIAIINRLFPPERRAHAMGYWAMVAAGGPVLGVVMGGPVVESFGWRWIFVAQLPLAVATLLLAWVVLPPDVRAPAGERRGFDAAGAATLGVGGLAILLAVNRGPVWGWSDPAVVAAFALTPLLLAAFVAIERRATYPLLPLRYLRRPNFAFPILTQSCSNFAYMGGFIITPLLLQNEFGYGETHTGWLLIARPLTFAIAGPVAGYLTLRIGERRSAVLGSISLIASMLALAAVAPGTSDAVVVGSLALSGLGMGAAVPALAASVANAVDEEDLGIAGATQQLLNQIGTVVGIQVLQTVQASRAPSVGGVAAYGDAYLVGGAVALLGLVFAAFVRSTRRAVRATPGGASAIAQVDGHAGGPTGDGPLHDVDEREDRQHREAVHRGPEDRHRRKGSVGPAGARKSVP
ncbi:MAG: MFS transporter, partial [Acidimicrobiales bacterium]